MTTGTKISSKNNYATGFSGFTAVTPSDTNEIAQYSKWLWVGTPGTGTLKVTTVDGVVIAFVGITLGWHPIAAKLVWSTGTNASNIIAAW